MARAYGHQEPRGYRETQVKPKPAFIYCIDWTYLRRFRQGG